jgi:putative tryptophan/tyrosine transport system substrate-binding protein
MVAPAPIVTRMNSHGWIFFVARRVSLLQSLSFSAKLHSQSSSASRSVVMAGAGDPVATGLVESLTRPGGNLTGQSSGGAEVAGKSLPPLTLTR